MSRLRAWLPGMLVALLVTALPVQGADPVKVKPSLDSRIHELLADPDRSEERRVGKECRL